MAAAQEVDLNFKLTQSGLDLVRDYVVDDGVALKQWLHVKDSLVERGPTRLKVDDLYNKYAYHQAIAETLQVWSSVNDEGATLSELISVLTKHDLNALARKLKEAHKINKFAGFRPPPSFNVEENIGVKNFVFGLTNLPHNFVDREDQLKQLHKIVTKEVPENDQGIGFGVVTCVHGLGGIGKSTLVRKYAWSFLHEFDGNVIWIEAETILGMRNSFMKVATELNLRVYDEISFVDLAKLVYNHFHLSKCLVIFDNVEQFDGPSGAKQFLPNGIPNKINVLITCRVVEEDLKTRGKAFELDVFSPANCKTFLQSNLQDVPAELCVKLAERLGGLPLALQLTVAYIKSTALQVKSPSYSQAVKHFLLECKTSKVFGGRDFSKCECYSQILNFICGMSLQKIQDEGKGRLAEEILQYMSLMCPDKIDIDFLVNVLYKVFSSKTIQEERHAFDEIEVWTEVDIHETLCLIEKYALITKVTRGGAILRIHRLVQHYFRESEVRESLACKAEIACRAFDFAQFPSQSALHSLYFKKLDPLSGTTNFYPNPPMSLSFPYCDPALSPYGGAQPFTILPSSAYQHQCVNNYGPPLQQQCVRPPPKYTDWGTLSQDSSNLQNYPCPVLPIDSVSEPEHSYQIALPAPFQNYQGPPPEYTQPYPQNYQGSRQDNTQPYPQNYQGLPRDNIQPYYPYPGCRQNNIWSFPYMSPKD